MSMRRGWYGFRVPRTNSDEFARFIQQNSMMIKHQKRNEEAKCTVCWDDIAGVYSPACPICSGSGYGVSTESNIFRLSAYVSYTQPYGNFGNSAQTFKAGGQHHRMSAYIYMDYKTGIQVYAGDRLIVEQPGLKHELVVMNKQPQPAGKVIIGYVFECATAVNTELEGV